MWPFRRCNCEQRIRDLTQERDQSDDAYTDLVQAKCAAESAMREMQKALTDEGVADIARSVTAAVADIYATAGRTVKQRDIAVHAAIAAAVRKVAHGVKDWDEGRLAALAQEKPA